MKGEACLVACYLCHTLCTILIILGNLFTEADPYFTVKLQDYTAVEKDDITLECELSKDVPVKWYKNGEEIKASKTVTITTDGKRRILKIKKVEDKNKGEYECDCGTDKTKSTVNIEGKLLANTF